MLLAFHLGRVCIFALHNNCLWHTFYSGAVTLKLFVTFAVLCFVPYFFFFCVCMRVCACACMYKRNPSVEHHPIAKFLEAAKVKSANFSDIIHLYSVCLLIEAAVFSFLPPIIPRQWLTSLAWHLCTEAHSPALDGERYFRAYCRAAVMQSPLFLHSLPLRLPHQQCNKCAPLFFASPA